MADIDDEEFINLYFAEFDNESEFKGFDADDLIDNFNIVQEIEFEQARNDIEIQEDVDLDFGWYRVDSPSSLFIYFLL